MYNLFWTEFFVCLSAPLTEMQFFEFMLSYEADGPLLESHSIQILTFDYFEAKVYLFPSVEDTWSYIEFINSWTFLSTNSSNIRHLGEHHNPCNGVKSVLHLTFIYSNLLPVRHLREEIGLKNSGDVFEQLSNGEPLPLYCISYLKWLPT